MFMGFSEIMLIVIFVLIVFGAKRIPELAKALGRAQVEYKKAKESLTEESKELMSVAEKSAEAEAKKESEKTQS